MLFQDVRFAFRAMRRTPASTLVAILILALGIGATTAVFTVVNAVLLRPLPYGNPGALVAISKGYPRVRRTDLTVSLDEVERWRRASRQLAGIGSWVFMQVPVRIGDHSISVVSAGVDPELLATLQRPPALGANFDGSGSTHLDRSAIITHRLWETEFGSEPAAVGRTIAVDGDSYTVTGVLPADFQFPRADASFFDTPVDLLIPVANIAASWGRTSSQWFAIGRLAPGATPESADAELNAIAAHTPSSAAVQSIVHVASLAELTSRAVRPTLVLILIAAAVLLLIACVNVMNLLFSRAAGRGREMAIRRAIGASTRRLIAQMLTESACLTMVAAAGGVMLARLLQRTMIALSPVHLPVSGELDLDARVLIFATLASALTAIVSGLVPAILASHSQHTLGGGAGTRVSPSRGLVMVQRAVTIAQIALGLALLTAAGLLANSLWRLTSVDAGFTTTSVLGVDLSLPDGHSMAENAGRFERVLAAVRALPGVDSIGWITNIPPDPRKGFFVPVAITGQTTAAGQSAFCNLQSTSEDYFRTLHIAILEGRALTDADRNGRQAVALVNETFARQYLAGGSPLGRTIKAGADGEPREIVGLVHDIRDRGPSLPTLATIYVPYRQFVRGYGSLVVHATTPLPQLVPLIRERVRTIDPEIPLDNFQTLDDRVRGTLGEPRFYTVIAAVCALMALLFVTLGLYGVVAYNVSQRRTEIGIRLAMGAQRTSILRLIVGQGAGMALAGVAAGTLLAAWGARLLTRWLFGIRPGDPATFATAVALLLAVTLVASYIPARRASRLDPLSALRQE